MSRMVSRGERGEKTVAEKVFLVGGYREVFVIKDEVGTVNGFEGETQE